MSRPMTAEERGDMAEALLPVAANLVALVHGDGGPQDVQDAIGQLDRTQQQALLVVLAGLVDPDQPLSKALGWLEFTEERELTVPPWSEGRRVRDLAPDQVEELGPDFVDEVAVQRYANGFGVEVTDEERLAAIRLCSERGMSCRAIDELRGLEPKSTENFVNKMQKRYERAGRAWVPLPRTANSREFSGEQARQIREQYAEGGVTDLELAMSHGVTRKLMTSLLNGTSYREAGGPIRAKRTPKTSATPRQRTFNKGPSLAFTVPTNQTRY